MLFYVVLFYFVLVIIVALAILSGITKNITYAYGCRFFGQYGFSQFTLVIYALAQLIEGILLSITKMRIIGFI
jgi:hypothetical protein